MATETKDLKDMDKSHMDPGKFLNVFIIYLQVFDFLNFYRNYGQ